MRLNPARFDAWLGGNIGQAFTWAKAYACACVNPSSGAANPACRVCFGRGRYWSTPVAAVAGVASNRVQQGWAQFGLYQKGDTVLSIPESSALYAAGQFDRILALNTSEQFDIVVQPTVNRILNSTLISIRRVFYMNAGLTATIDAGIPSFDALGNLTWPDDDGPPEEVQYSVSGTRFQEFFVFMDYPGNRNEHMGARLPKRLVARAFDLFGR